MPGATGRYSPHAALPVTSAVAGLLLLGAILPDTAAACAVCFGAAQAEAVQGLQAGILLLLAMVALVFAGVGAFLLAARRRVRRLATQPALRDVGDDENRRTGLDALPKRYPRIARWPAFSDQSSEATQ